MKFIFALLLLPALAHADPLTIYKCEYRIVKKDKPLFVMTGNIIAEDALTAPDPYGITYLTLAPNQLSGDTTEARILITSDGYNPITIHKAGNTATTLAATVLKGDHGELIYTGPDGTIYSVHCDRR